jgi:hypothetical protein
VLEGAAFATSILLRDSATEPPPGLISGTLLGLSVLLELVVTAGSHEGKVKGIRKAIPEATWG